jgi:thioredoxin-like negative regulator of GroEL
MAFASATARYGGNVPILSREEFDSLEFDAAASGDHAAAARQMSQLAATGTETMAMPRAEAFLRAAEQWMMADDPAEAVTGFERAIAEGGPVFTEPRVALARALFQLGREAEAQAIISALKAEGPSDPRICDMVAELLVERSDLTAALDWATDGVRLCLSQAGEHPQPGRTDQPELRLLLSLRYRIRNDLGLAEDEYDQMLDDA